MSKQHHRAVCAGSRPATIPLAPTPAGDIRAKPIQASARKTRLATTATLALAVLAANVAHAGNTRDKSPDYSVPGVGTIIAWLFGR